MDLLLIPRLLFELVGYLLLVVPDLLPIVLGLATPLALGALCGVLNERSGVVNIGIEGIMLMAAFFGYLTGFALNESLGAFPAILSGVAVAVATGAVLGLLHAWLTVSVRADQIIAGTMMNIAAFGVTGYLNRLIITPSGRGGAGVLPPFDLPDQLATLPFLGPILSMFLALPLGLAAAIYLSEYAHPNVRRVVKPVLEILAGIPTVVYGYFALQFISPEIIQLLFGRDTSLFNALSASIAMGIMILPLVSSLSEDAMRAVPQALREGAYGLGANKFEVATRIVVPAALSGIVAASILAISRAVGETMIVTIAAGLQPNLSWDPLEGMEAMTAFIVQVSLGDTPRGTLEYSTIFAVGMMLFLSTLVMNVAAQWLLARFREAYE